MTLTFTAQAIGSHRAVSAGAHTRRSSEIEAQLGTVPVVLPTRIGWVS